MSDERAGWLSVVCDQMSMEDILFLTVRGQEVQCCNFIMNSFLSAPTLQKYTVYSPVVHCVQQKRTLPTSQRQLGPEGATATAEEVSLGRKLTAVCVRMVFFLTSASRLSYGMAQGKGECYQSGLVRPAVWSANQMVLQTLRQAARWFYLHSLFSRRKIIIGGSCHEYHFSFGIFVVTKVLLQRRCAFFATKHIFCHDKSMLAMTKLLSKIFLLRQITCLSQQTSILLSWQTCLLWQK